ncbi:MAG TPA: macro domain-containing protein [Noviherbaspirillum sp.]
MIEFASGDILKDDSEALVNAVNCVGVMGRGIALQFKNAWPENFEAYALACQHNEVKPGRMFVFATGLLTTPKYIINFPTKRHWRAGSRMEDIDSGLADLVNLLKAKNIGSIAIPPLGSGLGGLEWDQVRPRIVAAMEALPNVRVRIYEPKGARAA